MATDWQTYACHIVRKMFKMHKFGEVHTIEEDNLKKGTKINSRQEKDAFESALKYLIDKNIILFKHKWYAKGGRAYFLNPSKSEEIETIVMERKV